MECSAGYSYEIYGLRLDSTRPIPGVQPATGGGPADVVVSLEGIPAWLDIPAELLPHPWHVSSNQGASDLPNLILWRLQGGRYIRFRYRDEIQFVVDRGGSKIWAQWPADMTLEDTYTYLLGPVLGFLLRLRGVLCLHASLVTVDGRALALLGPVGSGKSTTAAALAQRGCGVLSEDVAALTPTANGFLAQPGYGRIRLWPASSAMLFGSSDCLPKLAPPWDKRYLDLGDAGYRFQTKALPLEAIFLLDARTDSSHAPLVDHVSPRQGLVELVANTYMNELLAPEQRAQEFELLGRLFGAVWLRRLTAHANPERLDELCRLILDDFRQRLVVKSR